MTQRRDTGHVCSGEGAHREVVMKETLGHVCTPGAGAESFAALDESTYKQTQQVPGKVAVGEVFQSQRQETL